MSQKYEVKATAVSQVSTTDSGSMKQITTPTIFPASGFNKLYFKADNNLYMMNASGTETQVNGGGGGGSTLWHKSTFTFTDLSVGDLFKQVALYTLPAKGILKSILIHHTANFTGGSLTDYFISVGTASNVNQYTENWSVFGGQSGTRFQNIKLSNLIESMSASTAIVLTAQSTSDFLSAATQGSVDVYLEYETLP